MVCVRSSYNENCRGMQVDKIIRPTEIDIYIWDSRKKNALQVHLQGGPTKI